MKEISSRTLTILVVAALAISVLSTLVSVKKMEGLMDVTGRLSSTDVGTVNLTVASNAFVNLTDNLIEFGTMQVMQQNWSEQLSTNGDFFVVRNDGSVRINVSIYGPDDLNLFPEGHGASNCGGTADDDKKCVFVRCNRTKKSGEVCPTDFVELGESTTPAWIINNLSVAGKGNISLNVTVPSNATAGVKEASMTVLAIAYS